MASGQTVEGYIDSLPAEHAAIASELRQIVHKVAQKATESVKWGQPVFEENGPVCYIKGLKDRVNFGFWRGAVLKDPKGLLEGDGDRMKHIKISTAAGIPKTQVRAMIGEAFQLNRELGNPAARRR